MTMSIRTSLSALNGALLSTWWWIVIRLRGRESACTRGWYWLACALDRWHSRVCRVSAFIAPQQGYLIASNPSIPKKRRPAYKNSGAGMT